MGPLRGLPKFRLLAAKDWLGVLKALGKVKADAKLLPPADDVRSAAETFANRTKKGFPLFIKAPAVKGGEFLTTYADLSYWLVSFPEQREEDGVVSTLIRTKHPDGTGYIADWCPALGNVVIVAATHEQMDAQTREINETLTSLRNGLKTKIRLGELNEAEAETELLTAQQNAKLRFLAWAGADASGAVFDALAQAFRAKDIEGLARMANEAAQKHPDDAYLSTLRAKAEKLVTAIQQFKEAKANKQKADARAAQLRKQADEYKGEGFNAPDWRSEASRVEFEADQFFNKSRMGAEADFTALQKTLSKKTILP